MLESVYLLLLFTAFYAGKLAVIDRRAEVHAAPVSLALFLTLVFASFGVDVVESGQTTTVAVDPMIWLSLGGAGAMLGWTLLASIDRLPEISNDS